MSSDPCTWPRLKSGSSIRGEDALLTDEFAKKLGYAFALWLAARKETTPDRLTIAVGHDPRASGPRLKAAEDGLMGGGPSRRHRAAGCNWRASPFWRPRPPLSALRFRAFSGLPDGTPVWRAAQVRSGPDPMRPHGFLPDTPIIPHPDPGCGRKRPLRL